MSQNHQILIIGGGNAGISTASKLLRKNKSLDITIIEPSEHHYYQPAWTLVGAGVFDINKTKRTEASVMPKKVKWIKQKVVSFQPSTNEVTLDNNETLKYEYLIVAPGIQLNWNEIKGLQETLGKNGVCSNYSFEQAPYTWECIKNLKGGKALFTNPNTPVKCGGAPHKIMWLAADYFKKQNVFDNTEIQYWSGGTRLFGVDKYEKTLYKVAERDKVQLNFFTKLVEIDGPNKKAKFVGIGEQNKDKVYDVEFDMIHVTPPQSAPDFVRNSSIANEAGWVDVDKHTLQHLKYKNIFSLGDASSLPTSRTGAAIRKQAPVLVKNLLAVMEGKELNEKYNGYTSCPVVTGYGKLVLCEFDYNNQPTETFPIDQSKERWSMYQLKKKVLPWLYWNKILPGKM
ncbi:MAG: NAD(P)/FAD-dependent oxidoreductase [Chitinophagaceae bacterium]|nr:NAD(P)/FAD-dependent oxidoreductase [Chitinophagaceae bacterium]MBK8311105.1 NAD(P)/FAD-dependent oxidoreductase [Chitinophagaceae bacterium]MBK8607745.1 NAD(P)/FAD-dependent oxidoreductase [Chitinophagaceae bacterium]MBP7107104.1 NAD(P)/FAD-dependent oxidoreductase [Chitinophagaceae bacterium]MBP7314897.1 NAD(P)/FAD-dependent oxidoreductase [Chitinophagaceae bacterium]